VPSETVAPHHNPGYRRADYRTRQLELGQFESVGGVLGISAARFVLVNADQALVVKARKPLVVATGRFLGGMGASRGDLLFIVFKKCERLSYNHSIALLDGEAAHDATSPGDDGRAAIGSQSRRGRVEGRDWLAGYQPGADSDCRLFLAFPFAIAAPIGPVAVCIATATAGSYHHDKSEEDWCTSNK
jgi:hypothetical protein